MNILIISPGSLFIYYGGGQVYVLSFIDALVRQGFYPAIASSAVTDNMPGAYKGCKVYPFSPSDGYAGLEKLILSVRPDLVHAHGNKSMAADICYNAGIPCIITAHHGGIICPAGALLNSCNEICRSPISQKTCMPCCLKSWMPASEIAEEILKVLPFNVRLLIEKWMRRLPFLPFITPAFSVATAIEQKIKEVQSIAAYATRIVAPSEAIRNALVINGIPEKKIVHIAHGIESFKKEPFDGTPGVRPVRFIYLGRVNRVKGLHVLFRAFELLPDDLSWELHIYGDAVGKREKRYLAGLKNHSLVNGKIFWQGHVSHERIGEVLANCDMLVHPAICLEVFGLTILESFSVGRPVLATRCGGPEEIIRDDIDGYLVPPDNPVSLAGRICKVLRNPSEIMRLSSNIPPVETMTDHLRNLVKLYREMV